MLARLPTRRLLAAAGFAVALCALLLWALPSPDYLYLPNPAQPLDGRVTVQGGHPPSGPGGVYYLDVTVRKASWLESLLAFTRPDGASLVPGSDVVPSGSSFESERRAGLAQMQRSEQVAAAVALRQAGLHVVARPTGVLVEAVAQDAPAARLLASGDIVLAVDGHPVLRPAGLRARLAQHRPGDVVALRIRRGRATLTLGVKTVPSPTDRRRALIGIRVAQEASVKLPLAVHIDLGGVGGPSAGLPFALDVLEQLGRNVDRGYKVAATGELDLDGSVGPIGGVRQKTLGARQAGMDVLLVPAGENASEAKRYAGNLRVIPVESFQQALQELATLPPKG